MPRRGGGGFTAQQVAELWTRWKAGDTLPAMVLFVLGSRVVFHFAVPASSADAVGSGLLWVVMAFPFVIDRGDNAVPTHEE